MTSLTIAEMRYAYFFFLSRRWTVGPHRFYVRLSNLTKSSNYYEQNWGKEYKYVLAFTADKVEDVIQRYTQKWEGIQLRRLKNIKNNDATDFPKIYSGIK
ncbi:MAG: hypothetical protein ACJ71P_20270 [Nitrososphaeraceae archaeon]